MAGYAIGKFISGMVEGGEIRHRWQDRKREQQLQDEDRALAKEDRARRIALEDERLGAWREDRDYLRGERQYTQSERARTEAERAEREKVFADADRDAAASADQSLADALETQAGGAPEPALKPEVGKQPTQKGYGMQRPQEPAPGIVAPPEAPPVASPPTPESSPQPPAPPDGRQPAPAGLVAGQRPGAAAEPTISPMMVADAVNEPPWARRGRSMPRPAATEAVPPAAAQTDEPAGTIPGPVAPPSPDVAPQNSPPRQVSPVVAAAKPGAAAAAAPAPRAIVPSAAPDSPAPPVTPAVDTAVETARKVSPTSAPAARTFDQAFIEAYREEQVPKIARYYLSKGDVATAEAFQKWASDSATQEGMRAWGRAVAAATIGDEDGFLDKLVEAYNTNGYFDDGMSVIRDKSGFVRDESGNPTGAFITFRDDETGEEGTQRFDDVSDLYRLGINFLSPEAVFEQGMEMVKAADEAAKDAMKHERDIELEQIKAAAKEPTLEDKINDEVESLRSNDMTGSFTMLPVEEQVARAVESLRAKQAAIAAAAGGGGAPVAARGE